jgi:hypothetical protein
MNCPHCGHEKSRVLETRGDRRVRQCGKCLKDYSTQECLAAYAGKKAGWIHQAPEAEEAPPAPKKKRVQKYHPAVAIGSMAQENPELTQLLLTWWNEARWSKHPGATWTQSAWESTVRRVLAMEPGKAMKLAARGVETGWQTLQEKYLEGETSTDDGTVTPTNPAMRAALEAWN